MRSYRVTEAKMRISATLLAAASAVILFYGPASAGAPAEPARKTAAAPAAIQTQLAAQTTAQTLAPALEDFDALSTVNDPLYREGSKEFLKQVSGGAQVKPEAGETARPALRDAPNSSRSVKPAAVPVAHPAIKKPAGKKHGPADPVVIKNTL
jgi:hypothetical protein